MSVAVRAGAGGEPANGVRIVIDRMQVALHGVSPDLGEAFPGELGRALEQRLTGPAADALAAVDLRQLALGRIALEHTPEAGALAGLVAERLVEALVAGAGAARRA